MADLINQEITENHLNTDKKKRKSEKLVKSAQKWSSQTLQISIRFSSNKKTL